MPDQLQLPSDWFARFSEYAVDTIGLMQLTYIGIQQVHRLPQLVDILSPPDERLNETETDAANRERRSENADLANKEIASGFPLLHAHSLMGLWGALEAMVDDLALLWLTTHSEVRGSAIFDRIKISVGSYERMSAHEQVAYLIEEAKSERRSAFSLGVGQFEGLLGELGLSGGVHERVRSLILEAQQTRHLMAHRAGRVDARFLSACPTTGYSIGDDIRISRDKISEFIMAMTLYARTLRNRQRRANGEAPHLHGIPQDWEGVLDVT